MFNVDQKIAHLRRLGFKGNLQEIEKYYLGQPFQQNDENFQKLLRVSRELCQEFTALSAKLNDPKQKVAAEQRKSEIFDWLFPGHGMVYGGGDGLEAVIGAVNLGDNIYINARNHFKPNAIVTLNDYVFVATNVTFGDELPTGPIATAAEIDVGKNTWLCSDLQIDAGSHIGGKSVVGLGSVVTPQSIIKEETLAFGNPCMSQKNAGIDYIPKKLTRPFDWTDEEIRFLLAHVRKLGFTGDLHTYIQMLNGEDYNTLEPQVAEIHTLSHHLCSEYNDQATDPYRKKLILDLLFPIHGKNLTIGKDLYCDIIGATKMGDDVTIGDSVTLAGNIDIGNRVTIGNHVTLQCIGHQIYWQDRVLRYNHRHELEELNTSGAMKIRDGIRIHHGTKVRHGVDLQRDTQENELILK